MSEGRVSAWAAIRHSGAQVLANALLRRVIGAWGVWITAEWAVVVLLTVAGYARGGTAAVAVLAILRTLPPAIAAPVLGLLADRIPRAQVVAGVFVSWAALVSAASLTLHAASLTGLYVVVCVAGVASTLLRPGINGLMPQVVERAEELAAANSLYSVVEAGGSLVGPLVAGALIAAMAPDTALLVIAALLLIGAIVAASITTGFQPATERTPAWWRVLLEPVAGFAALTRGRAMRALFAIFMTQTFTRGLLNVFFVVIAVDMLHQDVDSASVLIAALGAGGVVGAVLTLATSGRRPGPVLITAMAMWGLPLLLIAAAPYEAVAWLALALIGLGNAVVDVFGYTLMQRLIPDHLLGRAFGAFWGGVAATQAVGAVVAPALISWLGIRGALVAGGSLMVLVVLVNASAIRAAGDQLATDPDRIAALQRCAVLAPLTRIALEQLARAAEPVDVPTGTTVIEQGTIGDRFYVVVDGALSAWVDGRHVRVMTSGDCFGEIAALNGIARTASAVADTECRLLALDGPTFVRAVSTHRVAMGAAVGLSVDRLNTTP